MPNTQDEYDIPPSQLKQLLGLLLDIIRHGYGRLEIEIRNHHIACFGPMPYILAARDRTKKAVLKDDEIK